MLVLGIESSCDETAAAVVRSGVDVLSNVVASQHDLHAEYGGVVPEIASRAHVERVTPVVRRALRDAGVSLSAIEAVAVGNRPGLIGALVVGVAAGKALAWSLGVPLVGVDHVRAHLYAGLLRDPLDGTPGVVAEDVFPAIGLVISGGHTALFRCESALDVRRLGSTIDDAVGEAYDKCAAMLGLGHPGGPLVDALAQRGNDRAHDFPVSRLGEGSLDFSFSGLKTSVLYTLRGQPSTGADGQRRWERDPAGLSDGQRADVCASFQRACSRAIVMKIERALDLVGGPGGGPGSGGGCRSIIVGGGVSANSRLRKDIGALGAARGLRVVLPKMAYCLDNAAMIAGLGFARLAAGERDELTLAASPSGAV